jgi:hypothetical protein
MTVDKLDKMIVRKMTLDKMIMDRMTLDQMSLDQMTIEQLPWRRKKLNFFHPTLSFAAIVNNDILCEMQ